MITIISLVLMVFVISLWILNMLGKVEMYVPLLGNLAQVMLLVYIMLNT